MLNNVAKMAKRMSAQIKPYSFDPFDQISILQFLNNCKPAFDTNGFEEEPAMWQFYLFMKYLRLQYSTHV